MIGSLSTKGKDIQKAAYAAILEACDGDRGAAWEDCIAKREGRLYQRPCERGNSFLRCEQYVSPA